MIITLDYKFWWDTREDIWSWLTANGGNSYVATTTTALGPTWKLNIGQRPNTEVKITITDIGLATAFKLRYIE